jgi:hypothetical protein
MQSGPKKKYITMRKWREELRISCGGEQIEKFEGVEYEMVGPAPETEELAGIIKEMRNGSTAGVDGMSAELLKNAPEKLIEKVWRIITEVWMTNKVSREWSKTVQIPISTSTDDYRRFTLCNVIYKIYAKILLLRLKENLRDLPSYQAAFQKNRLAGDHLEKRRNYVYRGPGP